MWVNVNIKSHFWWLKFKYANRLPFSKCETRNCQKENKAFKTMVGRRRCVFFATFFFVIFYLSTLIQIIAHKKHPTVCVYIFRCEHNKYFTFTQSDLCHSKEKEKHSLHMFQVCNREKVMRHMREKSNVLVWQIFNNLKFTRRETNISCNDQHWRASKDDTPKTHSQERTPKTEPKSGNPLIAYLLYRDESGKNG